MEATVFDMVFDWCRLNDWECGFDPICSCCSRVDTKIAVAAAAAAAVVDLRGSGFGLDMFFPPSFLLLRRRGK